MLEAQKLLAERFTGLRDSRAGSVFFIEHGLSETELERLSAAVRQAIWRHPPESSWWRACPLPLVVSATEVGYRYRGTGTDFWPKLERALDTDINPTSRQSIRDLFEECSSQYRGARPVATPWSAVFRLIAWPTTHALVPREFHRQLAATLANLRASVLAFDDASLHRAVKIVAERSSTRFASFLEGAGVAVSVIRALLGEGSGEISESAVARIAEDLASDPDARRDIAFARRAQQRLRSRPASPEETVALPAVEGSLQLRRHDDGTLTIEAQFPPVQGPDAARLRRTLRRRRFAPRLWGAASAVPSERFLSGLPFAVNLTSMPEAGAPLFDGLPELGLNDDLQRILESFTLDFHRSLLFSENADGDLARRVRGKEISGHRGYWLLTSDGAADTFAGFPNLGEAGPYSCLRLDPSEASGKEALERRGYSVQYGIAVAFAGAPPLLNFGSTPRFLVGDERVIVPRRIHPSGSRVELDGERTVLGEELVRVRIPEGKHVLEISNPGVSRQYPFEGVTEAASNTNRACWIELAAPEMTVQALLGGNMALRIDGLAPLEGLVLTIELEAAGCCVGTTQRLGPLPQILFGDHESWSTLLDKSTREQVLRDPTPVLHARVGALAVESWPLEQRLRSCWWVKRPSGFILESEFGPLAYGEVAVAAPTASPESTRFEKTGEARLLSPLDPDEATFGRVAQFTTLCVAPDTLVLSAPRMRKPRLCRSPKADGESLGAEHLAEAWLRWALAESDSLTAEIRRRQVSSELDGWFTEVVCGENWRQREALVNAAFADPWMLLADACRKTGRGLDPYVRASTDDEEEVIRFAVAEVRRVHPDLWLRIGLIVGDGDYSHETLLDPDHYDALDAAFERAYQRLADRYRQAGKEDIADQIKEADPGSAPEQWDAVLEHVRAASEMRGLGELLLPTHTATQLMALDPTLMPIKEMSEELRRWSTKSRTAFAGAVPTEAMLETILAFWIAPETAVVLDWRRALGTLLSERALARAARYLALRARNVRQGGVA